MIGRGRRAVADSDAESEAEKKKKKKTKDGQAVSRERCMSSSAERHYRWSLAPTAKGPRATTRSPQQSLGNACLSARTTCSVSSCQKTRHGVYLVVHASVPRHTPDALTRDPNMPARDALARACAFLCDRRRHVANQELAAVLQTSRAAE